MSDVLAYFTDRDEQIAAYDRLWQSDTPWILAFDGLSGNGKSTLLRWLIANRCQPAHLPHAHIDLYSTSIRQPIPFLRALAAALRPWLPAGDLARYRQRRQTILDDLNRRQMAIQIDQTITASGGSQITDTRQQAQIGQLLRKAEQQAAEALTDAALALVETLSGPAAIFLDTYEALQHSGDADMEAWLWEGLLCRWHELCPALRVVAAGRERLNLPTLIHCCAPGRLTPFVPADCDAFLRKRGLDDALLRAAIYRLTGGHPLLTDMAAELWQLGHDTARPLTLAELDTAPPVDGRAETRPEQWLYGRILDRLDPALRDAARCAILLRHFDRPTLNGLLPAPLDEDTFRRLAGHSFIEKRPQGDYQTHDLVRRAQLAWLRRADPQALDEFACRAEALYRARCLDNTAPDDLAEAIYQRCWHDEQGGIDEWDDTVQAHTLVADRERWRVVVRVLEGGEWAEKPLAAGTLARYAHRRGRWHYYNSEWDAALASYAQALALFQAMSMDIAEVGDRDAARLGEANVLQAIGDVQNFRDDRDAALASYAQALALFRQVGARLGEANVLAAQGMVFILEQPEKANDLLRQAIVLYQRIGDRYSVPAQIGNFGWTLLRLGEKERARPYLLQAAELFEEIGMLDYAARHRKYAQ